MKSTTKPSAPHWCRCALCCVLSSLFAASCLADEVFVVGNTAIPADSCFSFHESLAGTMHDVGSTARFGLVGNGTAEGGSLDIEDAKLLLNIQTQEFLERFVSESRSALISVAREFSISTDATVQVALDKEAADSELPKGEFVIVRSDKTSGEVPTLEITGVSPEQAARASLKLDEDGLSLIVAPAP
jgi:hypothetical protein